MIFYQTQKSHLESKDIETLVTESLLNNSPSSFEIIRYSVIPDIFSLIKKGVYRAYANGGLVHIAKYEDSDLNFFNEDILRIIEVHEMKLQKETRTKK